MDCAKTLVTKQGNRAVNDSEDLNIGIRRRKLLEGMAVAILGLSIGTATLMPTALHAAEVTVDYMPFGPVPGFAERLRQASIYVMLHTASPTAAPGDAFTPDANRRPSSCARVLASSSNWGCRKKSTFSGVTRCTASVRSMPSFPRALSGVRSAARAHSSDAGKGGGLSRSLA